MTTDMGRDEAKRWLRLFGDTPDDLRRTCVRGHLECSTEDRGHCLDDVLAVAFKHESRPDDTDAVEEDAETRPG